MLLRLGVALRRFRWGTVRLRLLRVLAVAGLVSQDYFEREVAFEWWRLAATYEREAERLCMEDDPVVRRRLDSLKAGPPR